MDLILLNSSESESDSDQEEYVLENLEYRRRKVSRVNNFIETVNNCTNKEFQQHFRINRLQFQRLLERLAPLLKRLEGSVGRLRIPVEKQLLAILRLMATPDSYRSVGCRLDMGKSSLFICFQRIIQALNEIAPEVIKWPDYAERQNLKEKFQRIAGLRGVIGAIDGTYVAIKAPHENPEVHINRKCFHAVTLQAIATPDLKFIDCFTGYPSSVSDIRIFNNSDIYNDIVLNTQNYIQADEHIIGDKAYPVMNWCVPPFINRGHLTEQQRHFNTVHAKTRQVVERAFALLFGRFRRLKYLDMNRIDLIPSAIIATCTLHNLCLLENDEDLDFYLNEGQLLQNHDDEEVFVDNNLRRNDVAEGQIKRNYLPATLP